MAHFLGSVRGDRGPATRFGSKKNGLLVEAKGHTGKITVTLMHRDAVGDRFSIWHEDDRGRQTILWSASMADPKTNLAEDDRIKVIRALLPAE